MAVLGSSSVARDATFGSRTLAMTVVTALAVIVRSERKGGKGCGLGGMAVLATLGLRLETVGFVTGGASSVRVQ
jgi:hypothetical protein